MIAAIGEDQTAVSEVNSKQFGGGTPVARGCRRESAVGTVAPGDHFLESPLPGDNVVGSTAAILCGTSRRPVQGSSFGSRFGSSLDTLCRFSLERTSRLFGAYSSRHKRRKIAVEENPTLRGSISASRIEVRVLGLEGKQSYGKRFVSGIAELSVEEKLHGPTELIHVSLPKCNEGRKDCTEQEEESESLMLHRESPLNGDSTRIIRPASLPNLHHEESGGRQNQIVEQSIRHTSLNDKGKGKTIPCGTISAESLLQSKSNGARECMEESGSCHESATWPQNEHHGEAHGSSWDFKVVASVKSQNRNLVSTDVIGTIAFEKTNEYFATGGIARKIRVYAYSSLASGLSSAEEDDDDDEEEEESTEYLKQRRLRKRRASATDIDHARCCVQEVCTPAKLSSLQWHQERPNVIACGDYDGVVAEWDVERTCAISERDENGGQRIWSIDYSNDLPDLIASASDDGTVRMWDRSSEQSVAILSSPTYSSICCAEFGPVSSSLIALASADSNVYLYDTRCLSTPLLTLAHHKRAASYVRFLNRHSLVSSSIDSSAKLWDISSMSSTGGRNSPFASEHCNVPVKSFDSHYNVRNFTGLSVRGEDGLIACGSETNQAFVYDSQRCSPILTHSFDDKPAAMLHLGPNLGSWSSDRLASKGSVERPEGDASNSSIVSAVCWRSKANDCTLVAANSDGVLRVLSGSHS